MNTQNPLVKRDNPTIQKLLRHFQPEVKRYASQIFNYERAGYDRSDIEQMFRIKLYTTLLAYGRKWAEYKLTGRYKPVPLEYYVKTTLVNKKKDLIKQFNQQDIANVDKLSFDGVDVGDGHTMTSEINYRKLQIVINEVDLLEGLDKPQRRCFILFLKGFTIMELKRIFKPKLDAEETIHKQLKFLREERREQLLDYRKYHFETHQTIED